MSLLLLIKDIRVEMGGIVAVHNGKPVSAVVSWLEKYLEARSWENTQASINVDYFMCFGPSQTVLVELISADADIAYTSLTVIVPELFAFRQVKLWLESNQGFNVVSVSGASEYQSYLFSPELGFAIRLVCRKLVCES